MSGKLYVVGTPIGNLSDMTPRALETLSQVDFIAAEDTRVTLRLLNHFEIKKPLISYYEHNKTLRGDYIIDRILAGEDCAIVSDAGMPCISDPGEMLVRDAADAGIEVLVVPLATAAMSALAISGLSTSRFSFEGFLSTANKSRAEHLKSIKDDTHTLIFYEAPHKLVRTLSDLYSALGNRRISLCRELTKLHEEVIRTTLDEAQSLYTNTPPKGEFVLIVEGKTDFTKLSFTLEDAANEARKLVGSGMKKSDAARDAAQKTGFKKSEIYKLLV